MTIHYSIDGNLSRIVENLKKIILEKHIMIKHDQLDSKNIDMCNRMILQLQEFISLLGYPQLDLSQTECNQFYQRKLTKQEEDEKKKVFFLQLASIILVIIFMLFMFFLPWRDNTDDLALFIEGLLTITITIFSAIKKADCIQLIKKQDKIFLSKVIDSKLDIC